MRFFGRRVLWCANWNLIFVPKKCVRGKKSFYHDDVRRKSSRSLDEKVDEKEGVEKRSIRIYLWIFFLKAKKRCKYWLFVFVQRMNSMGSHSGISDTYEAYNAVTCRNIICVTLLYQQEFGFRDNVECHTILIRIFDVLFWFFFLPERRKWINKNARKVSHANIMCVNQTFIYNI